MNNQFDYKKYLDLLNRHKRLFAVVALAIMTMAVVAGYVLPKKYEAKSTVFIEKNVISELVKGIAVTPSMDEAIKVLTYAITSRTLVQKVVDELDMSTRAKNDLERENLLSDIQKNVNVKVKDNNLFIISYTDHDPCIARDFVNTLVRRYIEENVSSKREESYGAIKFLSEQIGTFKEKLDKANEELNRFKREKGGVIAIDEAKLFEEINIAKQKLYDMQLRRRQLEGLKPVTRKAADPLETKLAALQKRLEELQVEYTDNYPEVIKVKADIDEVNQLLKGRRGRPVTVADPEELGKVEAELNALKISEEGMKRYIATNEELLRRIPSARSDLDRLELEKKNRKELYDQLMARQGQSEVSKQMEVQDKTTNFRIVDPAVMPYKPVSPNRVKIILMGIVGGLCAAFALLVGIDRLDPAIRDVGVIEGMALPVVAIIPTIRVEEEVRKEKRRDLRLYQAAGCYFTIILLFLVTEFLNLSVVDKVVNLLSS